ncbi:MAG: hypothetical protein LUH22_00090 [Bacteroides sp.]|nr:hypothetical protein [Bacteroides sp.]
MALTSAILGALGS